MKSFLNTLLMAAALLAAGCALHTKGAAGTPGKPGGAPASGHLVIIGGSLGENEQIYARMIKHAGDAPAVGIVPTASGDPADSAAYYTEAFDSRIGAPSTRLIDIPFDKPGNALDPAIAADIEACSLLFFTGGDQSRILAAFRPEGGTTPAMEAARAVLASGGTIAGSSAGAAMMSDPMLRWGTSAEALLVGVTESPDRGVGIGPGMGFFKHGLAGQHFIRRGRLGRMIAALEHTGVARGYGIADSRAIDVDLATGRIEVLGDRGILLVDNSAAEKDGLERRNIRLSLLNDGDVVDGNTGAVTPASTMKPVPDEIMGLTMLIEAEDAWSRDVFADLIEKLAYQPATQAVAHDEHFELRLSRDERTRFLEREGGVVTGIDVRLDIVPKAGADAARARLLDDIAQGRPGLAAVTE
mgnify:CR=1 FL=1